MCEDRQENKWREHPDPQWPYEQRIDTIGQNGNDGLHYKPGGSTPSQYALPKEATELQDLIEHREMNFSIGNIFKACYRIGTCDHSDAVRDLNKIIWFAERELKRINDGTE